MKKQQARQQREQHILQTLFKHLEQNRVLDLTMSDIAHASQCSMGAIYSHFPSKEDLIIAASNAIFNENMSIIEKISDRRENNLDKLLATILGLATLICEKPHFYALNQLAMNPNIWMNASDHRVEEGKKLSETILLKVLDLLTSISKERALELNKNDIELFGITLCGIVAGVIELKMSSFSLGARYECDSEDPIQYILPAICRLLQNWGITDANLSKNIENIHKSVRGDVI